MTIPLPERTAAIGELPDPPAALRASVVVPARDEAELIGRCLDALGAQKGIEHAEYELLVVLDACVDTSAAEVARAADRYPELRLFAIEGPGRGAGYARARGMDLACERLERVGMERGLIASTDADTHVAGDWLASQLRALDHGADAVGGLIELGRDSADLDPAVLAIRERELRERTELARASGPAVHAHFSGASLGVTPYAYRLAGGMAPRAALEDEELGRRIAAAGIPIHRIDEVRVTTSARRGGRAHRGLARDLEVRDWWTRRTYQHTDFPLEQLLAAKTCTVSVVLPAREVGKTIGAILDRILPLERAGLIDELLVVDGSSRDSTRSECHGRGVQVLDESQICVDLGRCRGKGDAMWRAASVTEGDVIAYLDGDTADFTPAFVSGLLGPILTDPDVTLVKGKFRRSFTDSNGGRPDEGGRVTELAARPLLNLHYPALAGFAQPLAGETAISRDLLEQLSIPVGYGVEIAMLIDAYELAGLDALAQVDLGHRQNDHQPLRALSAMAYQVLAAVERRVRGEDVVAGSFVLQPNDSFETAPADCWERPPLRSLDDS
ncbi:hypothetical protein BH24ACT23_BH24ACT23_08940 [soil metagenome]